MLYCCGFIPNFIALTILPITNTAVGVIWQLGLLSMLGFGLDPMSIIGTTFSFSYWCESWCANY